MHVAGVSLLIMVMWGTMCAQTNSDQAPSGTVVEKQHGDTNEVQPAPEKIRITPDVVRASQQKLTEEGYKPGTPDGKMGPVTRAAIRKYQEHEGLKVTATLDESKLSHLGIGGGKIVATAPGDIGRGAKAAAHNVKEGHPIAAGKAMGPRLRSCRQSGWRRHKIWRERSQAQGCPQEIGREHPTTPKIKIKDSGGDSALHVKAQEVTDLMEMMVFVAGMRDLNPGFG